ncbi:ankyrin repeat and IBR domain-containing protein 1 [Biomphalaria glabrata]|nr:ankyrin repeat and IBR domain-containing protein 1 [Biomphalaria glabrata]
MGSASSKFRKHLQSGDEVQALQLYFTNSELRKALDPNSSYGDSHQHETPLHLASRHGMQKLLGILLFSKRGNPNKTNARKETCLHCVCMESNNQSVHICNRRAECLNYLLKWRGATLSEGQIEKIDLQAQDEKLNTALHYAAASGLNKCVEILIQHGAPLFLENEDNLTPCDAAERNGHAGIALYLESKMVFSNDEPPQGDEDRISLTPVEEYSGLRPQDLQEAKDQLLVETADMLSVPLFTAEALLRNHEWSRETLLEAWISDPIACCEKCGVTLPSTLFSEKPQVQENLASPLPSPLHTAPTPLDAECNICANTFLIADEPVHMPCLHQFCKDCWERYLNVKIQEGDAHHITCPAYDCTMLVPVDIIEGIVSRDMALRYLQFDIKAFVDSNPDMKWCPSPGCGQAVKLPDLDLTSLHGTKRNRIPSDTSRGVDCGAGHYFCWECLEESHEPCSCDNWTKWFQKISEIKPETLDGTEQETELAANCLWLVTNSKPCPNCKSPIQKNEGCNHMKCSKCKYDFCWVCLEQWKRHNSSTGGYFKCNRYEVLKKVEEQSAQLMSEAESKNKNMQELNRFVHYYTRFKNHENSYKLEEPLLKTAKDKMMKLAEAVTDSATAQAETKFVEDAVQQLLKARRVLKCSYVYGYYLDGPGYKKIVFEFMQTELEECTEILSQMVNRLYLRTPRRKIIEQAHIVQRKRLEFIMAISKGLVPPETPPAVRRGKKKRKFSGGGQEDEDLHRAIVASIQEVNPANPWIKDASGRHTNVNSLLEWPSPSDESEDSDTEQEKRALRENIGKCHRSGCNKVRARNPKTNGHHDFCSLYCMLVDKSDREGEEREGISEIVLDEHMELLRALEMSRLQYLRDSGLLYVPDSQEGQKRGKFARTGSHRPRSNSAGQTSKDSRHRLLDDVDAQCHRLQDLSVVFTEEKKKTRPKSSIDKRRKLSQSSRFDESKSTIVTRVPNKSVEDLYCLDLPTKAVKCSPGFKEGYLTPVSRSTSSGLLDTSGIKVSHSSDALTPSASFDEKVSISSSSSSSTCGINSAATTKCIFGSMFGAIKDISVSNIHSSKSDKTRDFLSKDLALIFNTWDSDEHKKAPEKQSCRGTGHARRPLTLDECSGLSGKGVLDYSSGQSLSRPNKSQTQAIVNSQDDSISASAHGFRAGQVLQEDKTWDLICNEEVDDDAVLSEAQAALSEARDSSHASENTDVKNAQNSVRELIGRKSASSCEFSLLEMAENLLQITADVHYRIKEIEKGIRGLDLSGSTRSVKSADAAVGQREKKTFKLRVNSASDVIVRENESPPLPRAAWSDEVTTDDLSSLSSKSKAKSRKVHCSSKEKITQGKPLTLTCDTSDSVHQLAFGCQGKSARVSPNQISKLSVRAMLTEPYVPEELDSRQTEVEDETELTTNRDANPIARWSAHDDYCILPQMNTQPTNTCAPSEAQGSLEYSLFRNTQADPANQLDSTFDSKLLDGHLDYHQPISVEGDADGGLSTSALIMDAYEMAASEDQDLWEDASTGLSPKAVKEDQGDCQLCEEDDDDSVYV